MMASAAARFLPAMIIVALPCVYFPKAWPIPGSGGGVDGADDDLSGEDQTNRLRDSPK